jgi:dUTP pyrophosphatase
MDELLKKMEQRLLDVVNPEIPYTQEDFDNEFPNSMFTSLNHFDCFKMKINYVNLSNNPDPEYATIGSSGFDLRANLSEPISLRPQGGFAIIPTGLYFQLPENFEIQVRSRSGLAAKNQVCVLNSPGTVDSDYRGEIKVILINHGVNEFIINHGDRIAQAVVSNALTKNLISLNKTDKISDTTERNSGGFGSTGIK